MNTEKKSSARSYAPWLWLLLALFCLRVTGQVLVAFFDVTFLPPMEQWQSGLLPYPLLLLSQVMIILLLARVVWDFSRGHGYFVLRKPSWGHALVIFGWIYFGTMVVRYVIQMAIYPDQRWIGGTIPIIFHWVLATFLLLVGRYHLQHSQKE